MDLAHRKTQSIVEKIRTFREAKGYTQEYLAAKLSISQNAYSKIELGYSSLTVVRLFAIAYILEVDARRLISGTDDIIDISMANDTKELALERYITAL